MPVYSPVCTYCKNLFSQPGERKCNAFPNGIPLDIWLGLNKHRQSFPGDNGIRFEPLLIEED
ncbi:MAG TPA: hypothetical protein DCK76_11950 [Desulfotomaculum sp.]|nr:hypothetical protein [Desulfotomaculum sp.]HBY04193.1 hypothetical protein [Desulfotomaculum sp.]